MLGKFLILVIFLELGECSKILMIPFNHNSHANFFGICGEALQAREHEVFMLSHPKYEEWWMKRKLNFFHYDSKQPDMIKIAEKSNILENKNFWNFISSVVNDMKSMIETPVHEIMGNETLQNLIKNENFDLVIMDIGSIGMYTLPYKLNIPYITITVGAMSWFAGVPGLPSIEPVQVLSFTDDMNFGQRFVNFIAFIGVTVLGIPPILPFVDDAMISQYAPNQPATSYRQLLRKSEIFLINLDTSVLGTPRVGAPYWIYLNGLASKEPEPIEDPELLDFIEGGEGTGVILLSMGSLFRNLPETITLKLFDAFSKLEQRVIMTYTGNLTSKAPQNVMTRKWLQQNDILGHPNTILFITHAGNNGQMEASYHGVPMLCIPVGADQYHNARRVEAKGYGRTLRLESATSEEMESMIKEMIENKSYKEKAEKASQICKHLPDAREQFTFWVEHVIAFGSDHLRSKALEMSFFTLFSIDVIITLLIILAITLWIWYKIFKFCYTKCCKKTKPKTE